MKLIGKLLFSISALTIMSASAMAQSLNYSLSQFEGFYVGAYGGARLDPANKWSAGGIAGANFVVTDYLLVGLEAQAGAIDIGGSLTYDGLMIGKLGYEVSDNIMVYAAGGSGLIDGAASYALGGGAEAILIDNIGARAEVLGTGAWGGTFDATKASLGLILHLQ